MPDSPFFLKENTQRLTYALIDIMGIERVLKVATSWVDYDRLQEALTNAKAQHDKETQENIEE